MIYVYWNESLLLQMSVAILSILILLLPSISLLYSTIKVNYIYISDFTLLFSVVCTSNKNISTLKINLFSQAAERNEVIVKFYLNSKLSYQ